MRPIDAPQHNDALFSPGVRLQGAEVIGWKATTGAAFQPIAFFSSCREPASWHK
jgi:hypothetical protein